MNPACHLRSRLLAAETTATHRLCPVENRAVPASATPQASAIGSHFSRAGRAPDDFSIAPRHFSVAPHDAGRTPDGFSVAPCRISVAPRGEGCIPPRFPVAPNGAGRTPNGFSIAPFHFPASLWRRKALLFEEKGRFVRFLTPATARTLTR